MENVTLKTIKKTNPFIKFLDTHRAEKDGPCTHTSMGKPMGSFNIPEAKLEEFYDLYCKEVKKNKLHIVEVHSDVGPIVIDIDLRFDHDVNERQYTDEHIKKIIELYVNEIKEYFDIPEDEEDDIAAFVFERDAPYKYKALTKDGIHIMFPYIVSAPNVQMIMRRNVIKNASAIFEDIPIKNTLADIFDLGVIERNGWLMYGSSKPNVDPYQLTKIFDSNLEEQDIDVYNPSSLPKLLSIRNKTETTKINEEKKYEIIKFDNTKSKGKIIRKKKAQLSDEDIERIYNMTMLLSDERADNYQTWLEVGWCLHNIDPSNDNLLNIWIEFSKKSDKYEPGDCEQRWDTFKDDGLGIGSLYYWCKEDDYEGYLELRRNDICYYIEKSINSTNYDVASVLYELFKYQFVCASAKSRAWYEFKDHRWHEIDDGITLRKKISNELVDEYCKLISTYNDKITSTAIEDDESANGDTAKEKIEDYKNKAKVLSEIINKLKTTNFKDNIMKECRELFYERDFCNKLDVNPYLIGFENGVYDLKKGEFRNGRPDDYIMLTTGNDYIEYDEENEYVNAVKTFLSQILPNKRVRKFILTVFASFLEGINADESFYILTGTGRNGKSKIVELFELAFGEYCIKFPITLLTNRRAASNSATPEVAQSKGKRFGSFQEPDEDEKINVGLMKEMTGGDKIKARSLFKEPIEFRPQYKLMLLCNNLPEIPPNDAATWLRLKVTEFTSTFVDNPTKPNEFKKDRYLPEKLIEWKETFMSILLEYYKIYQKEGIKVPDEVLKYTNEFKKTNDAISQFFEKHYIKTGKKSDEVLISDMYREFARWFAGDGAKLDKAHDKKHFVAHLQKSLGKDAIKGGTKILGYLERDDDDDIEEVVTEEHPEGEDDDTILVK